MNSEEKCSKVLLADDGACRVLYCQHCNVAEVSVGAVSLRFYPESLRQLAQGLVQAVAQLERRQRPLSVPLETEWAGSGNVH